MGLEISRQSFLENRSWERRRSLMFFFIFPQFSNILFLLFGFWAQEHEPPGLICSIFWNCYSLDPHRSLKMLLVSAPQPQISKKKKKSIKCSKMQWWCILVKDIVQINVVFIGFCWKKRVFLEHKPEGQNRLNCVSESYVCFLNFECIK